MSEILIDDRAGSGDLVTYLAKWRVPHSLVRLPFGDAAVEGQSPPLPAERLAVGVEIKKVRDALCCMRDGRFAGHQLPGMHATYGDSWLLIEGNFGVDYESGVMTVAAKRGLRVPLRLGKNGPGFTYREFDHWLMTQQLKGGVRVHRTASRVETARFLVDLASWWEKPWDRHRSHLAFHKMQVDSALLTPPTFVQKVAATLPGIGWTRSALVAAHFGTVARMVKAAQSEWTDVDGIGPLMAKRIWEALHNA